MVDFLHCVSKKFPPLNCNFVKSKPIFKIFAPLESALNLLQNLYNIIHLTLDMSLHHLEKFKKIKISADIQQMWKKMQANCIFIPSNFVTRPQILIFSVFNLASFPHPILIANNVFMTLFFYLFTFTINLWHWKFVTADVTAVCVNNQHGIQRRGQDSDKNT